MINGNNQKIYKSIGLYALMPFEVMDKKSNAFLSHIDTSVRTKEADKMEASVVRTEVKSEGAVGDGFKADGYVTVIPTYKADSGKEAEQSGMTQTPQAEDPKLDVTTGQLYLKHIQSGKYIKGCLLYTSPSPRD